jgi:hypothetical protein
VVWRCGGRDYFEAAAVGKLRWGHVHRLGYGLSIKRHGCVVSPRLSTTNFDITDDYRSLCGFLL